MRVASECFGPGSCRGTGVLLFCMRVYASALVVLLRGQAFSLCMQASLLWLSVTMVEPVKALFNLLHTAPMNGLKVGLSSTSPKHPQRLHVYPVQNFQLSSTG